MLIEKHALWGEEPMPDKPATYTAYLADEVGEGSRDARPAVIICGGGGFESIAAHECEPVALEFINRGYQAFVLNYVTAETGDTISVRRTVFKGCDFSLTLPTLVNLHFLPYSLSSVREGVCRGFSLDGHNNDADHLFMCLFSICMSCWQSVYMSLCMSVNFLTSETTTIKTVCEGL